MQVKLREVKKSKESLRSLQKKSCNIDCIKAKTFQPRHDQKKKNVF